MNAAASTTLTTSPALRAYLRRATWGLPRARQQEVWDELEEHLLTRTAQLQSFGASPPEALTRALAELGPPSRVSAGMNKVYNMANILRTTAAIALSAAFLVHAGGGSGPMTVLSVKIQRPIIPSCARGTDPDVRGITVTSRKNGITCYTFNRPEAYRGAYLSSQDIKLAVIAQGGQARLLTSKKLTVQLPDATEHTLYATFTVGGTSYIRASTLLESLDNGKAPTTLSGFGTPELQFGQLTLRLGRVAQPSVGQNFYEGLLGDFVERLLAESGQPSQIPDLAYGQTSAPQHLIQTNLKAGEVVMLLTERGAKSYTADVAPVTTGGKVALHNPSVALRFVSDPSQLGPYLSGGRINALLVRVTNIPLSTLKSGIFVPAQANSDAR